MNIFSSRGPACTQTARCDGWRAFLEFRDVVQLFHTQRFCDPDGPRSESADGRPLPPALKSVNPHAPLPRLLRTMRAGRLLTHGEAIPDELMQTVLGPARETPAALQDPGTFPTDSTVSIAFEWDMIQGINTQTALSQAASAGQMLYWGSESHRPVYHIIPALDTEESSRGGHSLTPEQWRLVKFASNPNKTADRPSVLMVHEGMQVELTIKQSEEANVLKSAMGVVQHIVLDEHEDTSFLEPGSEQRRAGHVVLRRVPTLVLQVQGFTDGPIPGHRDLLIVEPSKGRFLWEWGPRGAARRKVNMSRYTPGLRVQSPAETWCWAAAQGTRVYQCPIIPCGGMTPYTAQGITAQWLLVLLTKTWMDWQLWWFQAYVALSRARHHTRLAHYGPVMPYVPQMLALGPSPHIRAEIARLKDLALKTRVKTRAAARLMQWPAPGRELAEWRRRHGVYENPDWATAYESGTFQPPPPPDAQNAEVQPPPADGPPAPDDVESACGEYDVPPTGADDDYPGSGVLERWACIQGAVAYMGEEFDFAFD
eukprot:gene9117-1892_t